MSGLFIPLALALGGLLAALMTYRGIRRGGARFYTLEREALLRRATLSLFVSVLLFGAAIGYLIYDRQQVVLETAVEPEEVIEGEVTITPTLSLEQFPPTLTPTPDNPEPTTTPTPIICRGIVEGTGGNGLTLREEPGSPEEITVLPDGSVLTVLDDESVEANGFVWRKVRVVGGDEGWVAEQFLTLRAPCN